MAISVLCTGRYLQGAHYTKPRLHRRLSCRGHRTTEPAVGAENTHKYTHLPRTAPLFFLYKMSKSLASTTTFGSRFGHFITTGVLQKYCWRPQQGGVGGDSHFGRPTASIGFYRSEGPKRRQVVLRTCAKRRYDHLDSKGQQCRLHALQLLLRKTLSRKKKGKLLTVTRL